MAGQKPVKAVIFDIGGVCVLSPMQGILDYERKNNILEGWINFAIRHSSPNGAWQRLERGEIKLDDDFYKGFGADLHSVDAWSQFNADSAKGKKKEKKTLKDLANPTRLGDPTSLKAETATSSPTEQDGGANGPSSSSSPPPQSKPTLSKLAKNTTIGDPIGLDSESVVLSSQSPTPSQSTTTPPPINPQTLLTTLLTPTLTPHPQIYPYLLSLSRSPPHPQKPLLIALSNTLPFPPDFPPSPPPAQPGPPANSTRRRTCAAYSTSTSRRPSWGCGSRQGRCTSWRGGGSGRLLLRGGWGRWAAGGSVCFWMILGRI